VNIWYEAHATLFQTTAIYVLLALSFQVVLKSGIFSFFSVGAFGIGAYTAANLATRGVPLIVTLLIVVVTMAAVGYLLAIPLMHLRGLYLGMVTFAIDEILVVVATNGGKITGGAVGLFGVPLEITTLGLGLVAVIGVLLVSATTWAARSKCYAATSSWPAAWASRSATTASSSSRSAPPWAVSPERSTR
jgi:branched-chain amino acid transport system permease protein